MLNWLGRPQHQRSVFAALRKRANKKMHYKTQPYLQPKTDVNFSIELEAMDKKIISTTKQGG